MWDFSEDKYKKDWEGWADMRAPWDKLLNVFSRLSFNLHYEIF